MKEYHLWRFVTFYLWIGLATTNLDAQEDLESDNQVIEFLNDDDSWSPEYSTEHSCIPSQKVPRYPVVLLHGFLGFDKILEIDYFYQVRRDYARNCIKVFTPSVSPLNYIKNRAEELAPQLKEILEMTGAKKLNLIAHSMGGLDARYLISTMGFGDRVASLTTIGTPHRGTPVPDYIWYLLGREDNILYEAFEYIVAGALSLGNKGRSREDFDFQAALWNLSPTFLENFFNPANPDDPRVYYQSYAGTTTITGITSGDFIDPLLYPFVPAFLGWGKNDGLVPLKSTKWGQYRGLLRADHIDLIGQLFGTTSFFFHHRKFYEKIIGELAEMGY